MQRVRRAYSLNAPLFSSSTRSTSSVSKQFKDKWPSQLPFAFVDYVNDKHNLNIPSHHMQEYQNLVGHSKRNWQIVDDLFEKYKPEIYPALYSAHNRSYQVAEPYSETNKYGEWACFSHIAPTNPNGPLKGKTFGIKDNINVAGIPCQNGSEIFSNFIPSTDASIVTRILEAGGTIIGKTQCEKLCYSGGSHTSYPAPVRNPHNTLHHAGGSSSGSGAAVAAGSCDIAIGGDQGGSIRLPSAWCGVVGFKPTWGLVPYTGAASLDAHFDHLGPMAKTVRDVVDTLKVIAGKDGYDLRQLHAPNHKDAAFVSSLDAAMKQKDVSKLKIGVLKQAFVDCQDNVDEYVMNAVDALKAKQVVQVDVPLHDDAVAIWCAIGFSAQFLTMYLNGGLATLPRGKCDVGAVEAYMDGMENGLMKSSPTNITNIIAGEWMLKEYGAGYYAKGTELARILKREYEKVMADNGLDVLIYPTIKHCAIALPEDTDKVTPVECAEHAFGNVANTMPSNVTGHPTLQIPVGYHKKSGLPIGMSIVAKEYEDAKCVHVANVYENLRGPLKNL